MSCIDHLGIDKRFVWRWKKINWWSLWKQNINLGCKDYKIYLKWLQVQFLPKTRACFIFRNFCYDTFKFKTYQFWKCILNFMPCDNFYIDLCPSVSNASCSLFFHFQIFMNKALGWSFLLMMVVLFCFYKTNLMISSLQLLLYAKEDSLCSSSNLCD